MTELPEAPTCIASYSTFTSGPRTSPSTSVAFPIRSAARSAVSGLTSMFVPPTADFVFIAWILQPSLCKFSMGSSGVSSIVRILYFWGISRSRADRSDVFPEPTPPATRTEDWPSIRKLNRPAANGVIEPVFMSFGQRPWIACMFSKGVSKSTRRKGVSDHGYPCLELRQVHIKDWICFPEWSSTYRPEPCYHGINIILGQIYVG